MEVVGSVAPEEVPQGQSRKGRPGLYTELAKRILEDHQQGRVTVIRVGNEEELKRLRNNVGHVLHRSGFAARPVIVKQGEELRVFMELVPYVKKQSENGRTILADLGAPRAAF